MRREHWLNTQDFITKIADNMTARWTQLSPA